MIFIIFNEMHQIPTELYENIISIEKKLENNGSSEFI